jgi:hypothetical protein
MSYGLCETKNNHLRSLLLEARGLERIRHEASFRFLFTSRIDTTGEGVHWMGWR